jgi:hypothetical protein
MLIEEKYTFDGRRLPLYKPQKTNIQRGCKIWYFLCQTVKNAIQWAMMYLSSTRVFLFVFLEHLPTSCLSAFKL